MRQGAGPLHPSWPGVGGGQARPPLLPCHWGGCPRPPPRCCPGRQSRLPGRPRCAPSAPACPPARMRTRPGAFRNPARARRWHALPSARPASGTCHVPDCGTRCARAHPASGTPTASAGLAPPDSPPAAVAAKPSGPLAADRGRYSVSICIWPSTLMSRPDSCSGSCLLRLLESRSFALSSSRSAFIFS